MGGHVPGGPRVTIKKEEVKKGSVVSNLLNISC